MKRALDTAQAIANHHQLAVQVEPDLKELEVGEFEGITVAELGTNFSNFLLQWRQGQGSERMPGGESLVDLGNRVWPTVCHIVDANKQGTTVAASHFFVIVAIVSKALGLPVTHIGRIRVQPGSASILDFEGRHPCLVSLGDTCHLRES